MTAEDWHHGQLVELSHAECRELLMSKTVGRLAYLGPVGLEVIPFNYVVQPDDNVLFRTSPHSSLGRQLRLDVAAFEVDDIDDVTQSGWSVLMRGTVLPVDLDDLPSNDSRPTPWPSGARMLYLQFKPSSTSGRRLMAT